MPTIFFANLDALRLALASGAVPSAVGAAPARVGFDTQGRLWLQPEVPLPRDLRVIVQESNPPVPQQRADRDPHVRIPQVRP